MPDSLPKSVHELLFELLKNTNEATAKNGQTLVWFNSAEIQALKQALQKINHQLYLHEQHLLSEKSPFPNFQFSKTASSSIKSRQLILESLSEREIEILHLIGEGLSNQAISETLNLKLSTIKWYSTGIYEKLCVDNRTQAAKKAKELKLI